MVGETEDAIAEANSQLVAFGHYTPVIVLFDTNQARLRRSAGRCAGSCRTKALAAA